MISVVIHHINNFVDYILNCQVFASKFSMCAPGPNISTPLKSFWSCCKFALSFFTFPVLSVTKPQTLNWNFSNPFLMPSLAIDSKYSTVCKLSSVSTQSMRNDSPLVVLAAIQTNGSLWTLDHPSKLRVTSFPDNCAFAFSSQLLCTFSRSSLANLWRSGGV